MESAIPTCQMTATLCRHRNGRKVSQLLPSRGRGIHFLECLRLGLRYFELLSLGLHIVSKLQNNDASCIEISVVTPKFK